MRKVVLAGVMLACATGVANAADPGPDNLVIACTGAFAADANREKLVSVFGAANVVDEDVDVGEGMTEPATVLYPNDATRRAVIFWADMDAKARPMGITVREEGSLWRGPKNIGIGTKLADVEKANGKPFVVVGFDWDMGGYAGNWEGGTLATITGNDKCPFSVRFTPTTTSGDYASGDAEFASNSKAVRAAKAVVQSIGIGWAQEPVDGQ